MRFEKCTFSFLDSIFTRAQYLSMGWSSDVFGGLGPFSMVSIEMDFLNQTNIFFLNFSLPSNDIVALEIQDGSPDSLDKFILLQVSSPITMQSFSSRNKAYNCLFSDFWIWCPLCRNIFTSLDHCVVPVFLRRTLLTFLFFHDTDNFLLHRGFFSLWDPVFLAKILEPENFYNCSNQMASLSNRFCNCYKCSIVILVLFVM